MIRAFLLTILLAAIFAGLSYPVYEWILARASCHVGREAPEARARIRAERSQRKHCPHDCPCELPKPGLRSQEQPSPSIEEVIEK
jgi:hypothetical protein